MLHSFSVGHTAARTHPEQLLSTFLIRRSQRSGPALAVTGGSLQHAGRKSCAAGRSTHTCRHTLSVTRTHAHTPSAAGPPPPTTAPPHSQTEEMYPDKSLTEAFTEQRAWCSGLITSFNLPAAVSDTVMTQSDRKCTTAAKPQNPLGKDRSVGATCVFPSQ